MLVIRIILIVSVIVVFIGCGVDTEQEAPHFHTSIVEMTTATATARQLLSPTKEESFEDYHQRLVNQGFNTKFDYFTQDDREEYKFLLPTTNMKEVYAVAHELYPMDSFSYPSYSRKKKEVIIKPSEEEDLVEKMTILRNTKGRIEQMKFVADFGDYKDEVLMALQNDKTLLIFGSYDTPEDEY